MTCKAVKRMTQGLAAFAALDLFRYVSPSALCSRQFSARQPGTSTVHYDTTTAEPVHRVSADSRRVLWYRVSVSGHRRPATRRLVTDIDWSGCRNVSEVRNQKRRRQGSNSLSVTR